MCERDEIHELKNAILQHHMPFQLRYVFYLLSDWMTKLKSNSVDSLPFLENSQHKKVSPIKSDSFIENPVLELYVAGICKYQICM